MKKADIRIRQRKFNYIKKIKLNKIIDELFFDC